MFTRVTGIFNMTGIGNLQDSTIVTIPILLISDFENLVVKLLSIFQCTLIKSVYFAIVSYIQLLAKYVYVTKNTCDHVNKQ